MNYCIVFCAIQNDFGFWIDLKHRASWKKSDTKDYVLCDSIYMKFWRENSNGRNQILNAWSWAWWKQMTSEGYEKIRGGENDVCFDYHGGYVTVPLPTYMKCRIKMG